LPPAPERDSAGWRLFPRQQAATMLACAFLPVETVWLTRIYVPSPSRSSAAGLSLSRVTSNPDGRWLAQQARNLLMLLADRQQSFRFLLHDRDRKFSDEICRSEGMKIVQTPIRAPNANAYAERWVGTLRRERLDRILIVNRRQLAHALRAYTAHDNRHRPHRSLSLRPPDESASASAPVPAGPVRKREPLGGLINEDEGGRLTAPPPRDRVSEPHGFAFSHQRSVRSSLHAVSNTGGRRSVCRRRPSACDLGVAY
jgi:hypothetical protein